MKKIYEEPDVKIIICNLEDVIRTSDDNNNDNETPIIPFGLDHADL